MRFRQAVEVWCGVADPKKGIPLTFRIYAGGVTSSLLDARPLSITRPIVPFGEHVISIVISEFDPSRVVLLFAAKYEEKGAGIGYSERDTAGALHFASASEGSWKYLSVEPQGNSWQLAGFDDSAWTAMPARDGRQTRTKRRTSNRIAPRNYCGWGLRAWALPEAPQRFGFVGLFQSGRRLNGQCCHMLATEHLNMVGQESSAAGSLFVLILAVRGSSLSERRTCRYLPFDVEATQLLQALAQENIDSLMERTKDRSRRKQVARFYEAFYALAFYLDGCFVGEILNVKPPANHLTVPLAVHLEISDSCNLRCCHCFAGELDRQESPLGSSELERLLAQMSAMGSYRLGLTGGEPLLREDLFEVIDLALMHGLSPCVTTNGMLIDEATARESRPAGVCCGLTSAWRGASPATNDLVRGRGSFERVIENLRILSKYSKFSLAFTGREPTSRYWKVR